ncbi:T9SS type A sorting domain-containing protein [bacterium]|nr:T9SS type A sorting domain-containing protein [bacterium]
MKIQNQTGLFQNLKVVQIAAVTTVVLSILAAIIFFNVSMFSSKSSKAATTTVGSGNTVYASDLPFGSTSSGDSIVVYGKFYIDEEYTQLEEENTQFVFDGTNSELKIFAGNNIYLGAGSSIVLLNSAKIKIVGPCNGSTGIYIGDSLVATCDGSTGYSFDDLNGGDVTLPVSWIAVDAKKVSDGEVEITWSTASEINNEYFQVEYSTDGVQWNEGKSVPSKAPGGNSQSVLDYKSFHYVNELADRLYFRIKQVDFNKDHDYSDIAVVKLNQKENIKISSLGEAKILVTTTDAKTEGSDLTVYNTSGQQILSQPFNSGQTLSLPSPGVYIIQIGNGADVQRIKHMVL